MIMMKTSGDGHNYNDYKEDDYNDNDEDQW